MIKLFLTILFVSSSLAVAGPQYFSAINNTLRDRHLEYNPTTAKMEPATLLEGYSRNVIQNSDAAWGLSNFTIVFTGVAGAPDGTATAIKVVEDTNNVYHRAGFSAPGPIVAGGQSISFCARAGERTKIWVNTLDNIDTGSPTIVNLLIGAVESTKAGQTVRVTPIGSAGWWLIEVMWTVTTPATDSRIAVGSVNAAGATSYTGDGVSGFYLWRINYFNNQPTPSSLIFSNTNGAGYTTVANPNSENSYGTGRFPDYFELDGSPLSVPGAVTGFVEFIEKGSAKITGSGVWYIGKADGTGARFYVSTGTNGYRVTQNNGTTAVTSELAAFPAFGDLVRLRWILNADGSVQIFQSINGRTETSASASAANTLAGSWGANDLYLDSVGYANLGFIALRKMFVLSGNSHPITDFTSL